MIIIVAFKNRWSIKAKLFEKSDVRQGAKTKYIEAYFSDDTGKSEEWLSAVGQPALKLTTSIFR